MNLSGVPFDDLAEKIRRRSRAAIIAVELKTVSPEAAIRILHHADPKDEARLGNLVALSFADGIDTVREGLART